MPNLVALDRDLWEQQGSIRVLGVALPRRMVVVRLASGGLWVWSPNRLDAPLRAELEALGPVAELVAPSRFHHAHLAEWCAAFPGARLWGAPGLGAKCPGLPIAGELGGAPPEAWGESFEMVALQGVPKAGEVALWHRPTQTAILCDLVFHIGPSAPLLTRLAMRLNGGAGLGPTRVFRSMIEDRVALRSSLDAILAWDFERLLMAHGDGLERGGREALRAALAGI